MISLQVMRQQNEQERFDRLRVDDARTALPAAAAEALAADLRTRIRGEVRFDDGSRALYATDGSNYRQVPIGVVVPREKDDVIKTVAAARRFNAPILSRLRDQSRWAVLQRRRRYGPFQVSARRGSH